MKNKVYKIVDKKSGEHIPLGYNKKSSWHSFPSAAIKCSKHIIDETNKDDFYIEEYEMVLKRVLSLDKIEIKKNNGVLSNDDFDKIQKTFNLPAVELNHKSLQRFGDSIFKSICPFCADGILPVQRNRETFLVEKDDHCLSCGRRVVYLDISYLQ